MYTVIAEILHDNVQVYGIQMENRTIRDITTDRERLESFVEKLNRLRASTIHIDELVYDFLCIVQ